VQALRNEGHKPRTIFAPKLERTFMRSVDAWMGTPRKWGLSGAASLMKVFLPYLTNNTVFGNDHVVEALGEKPVRFSEYAYPLLRFAVDGKFAYPY
jgi:hypothetical protein